MPPAILPPRPSLTPSPSYTYPPSYWRTSSVNSAMFSSDSVPPLAMKTELLDMDFSPEVDFRKRRRNRTTQSCLNCHTSKRKCDRKRPCQRCIQLGLTGLCVYEVDDPALRDDPDIDETTRLRNRIAELESLVRELRGKPHPRWADQTYYDGDTADKWHTRSQRRANGIIRSRRMLTPPAEHPGLIKAEPLGGDAQHPNCYYRLSPSPPPLSASSASSYSLSMGHVGGTHYVPNGGYSMQMANGGNVMNGGSPATYSPSSGSSSSGGIQGRPTHNAYGYEDTCSCIADPAANHSYIALARQLEGITNYIQHLPSHSQSTCEILRRIKDLKSVLHGDSSSRVPASSPATAYGNGNYETGNGDSIRSPAESDLLTPLSLSSSVGISAPATPHGFNSLQWGTESSNHPNTHPNATYFSSSEMYAKQSAAYDVAA